MSIERDSGIRDVHENHHARVKSPELGEVNGMRSSVPPVALVTVYAKRIPLVNEWWADHARPSDGAVLHPLSDAEQAQAKRASQQGTESSESDYLLTKLKRSFDLYAEYLPSLNAQNAQAEHPEIFKIPSDTEVRATLAARGLVKVGTTFRSGENMGSYGEGFWVKVLDPLEILGDPFDPNAEWVGRVHSELLFKRELELNRGQLIIFTPNAVLGVHEAPAPSRPEGDAHVS